MFCVQTSAVSLLVTPTGGKVLIQKHAVAGQSQNMYAFERHTYCEHMNESHNFKIAHVTIIRSKCTSAHQISLKSDDLQSI